MERFSPLPLKGMQKMITETADRQRKEIAEIEKNHLNFLTQYTSMLDAITRFFFDRSCFVC